ncbi:methionine ABC transporter ATP-binding protein [Ammoniphilus sp. CFH 90114]|uniref:methionine ABC transporter ATP-binding protein n=1 Tax=Ammoniphilus sp. CFH 90114 TaxID=2493665 RepID=UPI00100F21FE|nr:methionine ABC transporter ATP-binding protein [Ammoniphilus sp. CFH 90114]RXT15208.1 methionine ABC transporter ATP-binding protein [Ammoniphilus sp. CFH 90114]
MIVIKNLYKTYEQNGRNVEAVKNVSLEIKKGEIFGVIGFSGAGKSSLIRCVNLLETPSSGSVMVNGVEMTNLSERNLREARRKIGMIFQHFNLLSSSTVFENIAAPLELANTPKHIIEKKVNELLGLVGLSDKGASYPSQLSGGQKQRVAIARALANDPEILLCDEATSALDPQTTDSILDLLLDINKKFQITIMLITHEMHVIKKICDHVAVMENGQVVEQGSVLEIFSQPKTQTTKNFIKNVFDINLPQNLQLKFKNERANGEIIRVSFVGETTTEPVFAELATRFPLRPNILFGNITQIKETTFGSLILKLTGEASVIQQGMEYLQSEGLSVEVLQDVD